MKCTKCGAPVGNRMLYRTSEPGTSPANWMCMPCIQSNEPELANNLKEEFTAPDGGQFENIFYPNKP